MNAAEHLLTCLAEECGEVSHETCKALRFGPDDRSPLDPAGPTNRERLVQELNEIMAIVRLLEKVGLLPPDWENLPKQEAKRRQTLKFMDYAIKAGTMDPNLVSLEKAALPRP